MFGIVILVISIFAFIGIYNYFKQLPHRRKVKYYFDLFERLKMQAVGGEYPLYLGEQQNEYTKEIAFQTLIPLNVWNSNKELLAMHIHENIIKIESHPKDNNHVHVFIQIKDLPSRIDYDLDKHWGIKNNVLVLGVGCDDYVTLNLNENAHAFIAGETGSGKSNILKGLIYQSLLKGHDVKLIDFKRGVSFSKFKEHIEILSDYNNIVSLLDELVKTVNHRYDLFTRYQVEEMEEYNKLPSVNLELRRIVVFIDELAELIKTSDKELTKRIVSDLESLTRLSRAAGVNLIMGLQRPDSTVITGQIKNNVSYRVCGRFVDPEPSRIMLGNDMASKIPKIRGRFILKDTDYIEFQAFMFEGNDMNLWTVPKLIKADEKESPSGIPTDEDDEEYPVTEILTDMDEPIEEEPYMLPYIPYSEEELEPKRVYIHQPLHAFQTEETNEEPKEDVVDNNGDIVFNFDKIKL